MNTQQKRQKKTSIWLFEPIRKDEHQNILEHEIELLKKTTKENYLMCNVKMFKWLTQQIQSNFANKSQDQTRAKSITNKKKITHVHKCRTYVKLVSTRVMATDHGKQ
jgi:hypothetical protein